MCARCVTIISLITATMPCGCRGCGPRPCHVFVLAMIAGASALRFNLGLPGFQAEFSANFGGFGNLGSSSSSSSSSGSASRSSAMFLDGEASLPAAPAPNLALSGLPGFGPVWNNWPRVDYDPPEHADQVEGENEPADAQKDPVDLGNGGGGGGNPATNAVSSSALDQGDAGGFASWSIAGIPFGGSRGSSLATQGAQGGIAFYLCTRDEPTRVEIGARHASSLRESTFSPERKTKFVIHGYNSNSREGSGSSLVKDALLEAADVNVILVDYSAVDLHIYLLDVTSLVPAVGAETATLIQTLVEHGGADEEDVHVIGHSLGAQIAGVVGSIALGPKDKGWITGLDPAGPMFEGTSPSRRLDETDAAFVDAVHTDGGYLGIKQSVGHVDFFVDGGMHRHAACGADVFGICTHCFAFEVYVRAISERDGLVGTKCGSLSSLQRGDCLGNEINAMGLTTNHRSRGSFQVDSKIKPSQILRDYGSAFVSRLVEQVTRQLTAGLPSTEALVRC